MIIGNKVELVNSIFIGLIDEETPELAKIMIWRGLMNEPIDKLMEMTDEIVDPVLNIYDWEKADIIGLLFSYDGYVADYPEYHDEGCYPVCLSEFLMNEYWDEWLQ